MVSAFKYVVSLHSHTVTRVCSVLRTNLRDEIEAEALALISYGNDVNQQHLPQLVTELKKLLALLSYWTGVMVPAYRFGGPTASSEESETNFKNVKHIVSRHLVLPARIDDFL